MDLMAVYSRMTAAHTYVIVRDIDDGNYMLMIDDEPYSEGGQTFLGTFYVIYQLMETFIAAEDLATLP
jgi:hypothetical protein